MHTIASINCRKRLNQMDSPVSKNELKEIEASLREWHKPVDFGRIADLLSERMPDNQFKRQPGLSFFREAIIAADFAKALNCEFVRLCDGSRPDFATCKNGIENAFELVEAMEKDRKRGNEDWTVIRPIPLCEWHKAAEMIPRQLREMVKKKVGKKYPSREFGLMIYLNICTFGLRQKEVEADFHAATELAKDQFNEVWIAWGMKHYLLWRDGRTSSEVIQEPTELR
jgi:hypothetical protein